MRYIYDMIAIGQSHIVKRNNWVGTGFEKSKLIVARKSIPPWANSRQGSSALSPAQKAQTQKFANASVIAQKQCAVYSGKKKMACRASVMKKSLKSYNPNPSAPVF